MKKIKRQKNHLKVWFILLWRKLTWQKISFGGDYFTVWNFSGFVYPLGLTKTMIETLPYSNGIIFPIWIDKKICTLFQMFYNVKFCHNRRNDFRVSISADSRSCVEQIFQSFWAWLDHMDNRLAKQHLQSSTTIHSNN